MKLLKTLVFTLLPIILLGCVTTKQPKILRQPTTVLGVVGDVNENMATLWEAADRQLSAKPAPVSPKDTFLISISSLGGRVDYMETIIGHMRHIKSLGYKIQCVATLACSSAFMIWMECDERYTYQYSYLMFHYPRYGIQETVTLERAKDMYESLSIEKLTWLALLDNKLGKYFTIKELDEWATRSKNWSGEEFCDRALGYCAILR